MTATEVFESVTNGGASDFAEVVAILDQSGAWCLIGGLAVNCYVEPVYTVDADIVVATTQLEAIRRRLSEAGFALSEFPHSLNAQKQSSKLRVQFTSDERYQSFIPRTQQREVLGQKVPVASLEDVIQGKIWAWKDSARRVSKRKKDELDLLRIGEGYPQMREKLPNEIVDLIGKD